MSQFTIKPLSDQALLLQWSDTSDLEAHRQVMDYHDALQRNPFTGFVESVPAFTSLAVYYDVTAIRQTHASAADFVMEFLRRINPAHIKRESGKLVTIPVRYGGAEGPDLEEVAGENGINTEELVRLHTGRDYHVFMIGFTPGFPYLGFTHENLSAKRKSAPRLSVPEGSVGLAGNQTGIYPASTPGGWQIIGRTAIRLFDADREQPCLLEAGDRVRFIEVT